MQHRAYVFLGKWDLSFYNMLAWLCAPVKLDTGTLQYVFNNATMIYFGLASSVSFSPEVAISSGKPRSLEVKKKTLRDLNKKKKEK